MKVPPTLRNYCLRFLKIVTYVTVTKVAVYYFSHIFYHTVSALSTQRAVESRRRYVAFALASFLQLN